MIEPYPGSEVSSRKITLPQVQVWSYRTLAEPEQVRAYYRAQLESQGWAVDKNGVLFEERACPKLALDIRNAVDPGGGYSYTIELVQTPCRTYC